MKKKYHIEGIDCANCAAKVEKKMNELPDVSVILTFATSQLLVEAENPDEILPKLRKIADKMEPGTVIEEISKAGKYSGKKKPHHHHDDDDCCCGEHDEQIDRFACTWETVFDYPDENKEYTFKQYIDALRELVQILK